MANPLRLRRQIGRFSYPAVMACFFMRKRRARPGLGVQEFDLTCSEIRRRHRLAAMNSEAIRGGCAISETFRTAMAVLRGTAAAGLFFLAMTVSTRATATGDQAFDITAPHYALAMHGGPALPPDFTHLPYANPRAPKGGRLVVGFFGTFDSLNPFNVKSRIRCARPHQPMCSKP